MKKTYSGGPTVATTAPDNFRKSPASKIMKLMYLKIENYGKISYLAAKKIERTYFRYVLFLARFFICGLHFYQNSVRNSSMSTVRFHCVI